MGMYTELIIKCQIDSSVPKFINNKGIEGGIWKSRTNIWVWI